MTKEQFENLKRMAASKDVKDVNLAGPIFKAMLFNRKKPDMTYRQFCGIVDKVIKNDYNMNDETNNKSWMVNWFNGDLQQI